MTPTEALSRLAAAGRIRSAWLPGMRDERGNLAIVTDKRGASAWFPPWFDYEPLPSVRIRDDEYETFGETPADDPATTGCLLALLREAVGSPYLSPVWNAYLGRRYDPSDPGPDDFDNPPGDVSLDNARQWRIELCGAPDEVYDRLGTDLLGEGATEYAAIVAALVSAAERLEPTP